MLQRHYRHWTPQEDAELIASVGTRRLITTAANLGRTADAARRRAVFVLHLNHQYEGRRAAGMSMADVGRAMGISSARVSGWVTRRWLKTHAGYGVVATYTSIDPYDVSTFLSERGALLPYLQPTELAWREEVTEARARLLARYIDSVSMRRLLHWSRGTRTYVQRRHRFDTVATLSIGHKYPTWYERESVRNWLGENPQYWTQEARDQL